MTKLSERREWFDNNSSEISQGVRKLFKRISRVSCPCCGYPTLTERGLYGICELCNWEDDGQDDEDSHRRSGPNNGYSLDLARKNFSKYLTMYSPDNNPTIGREGSRQRPQLKKQLISVFEQLVESTGKERDRLWLTAFGIERKLYHELKKSIKKYEQSLTS